MTTRGRKLDQQFFYMLKLIQIEKETKQKYIQIRVDLWIQKLCVSTNHNLWKKSRNQYAALLVINLERNYFESPFNKSPPEGFLKKLDTGNIF